jgi:hypothetical protein
MSITTNSDKDNLPSLSLVNIEGNKMEVI